MCALNAEALEHWMLANIKAVSVRWIPESASSWRLRRLGTPALPGGHTSVFSGHRHWSTGVHSFRMPYRHNLRDRRRRQHQIHHHRRRHRRFHAQSRAILQQTHVQLKTAARLLGEGTIEEYNFPRRHFKCQLTSNEEISCRIKFCNNGNLHVVKHPSSDLNELVKEGRFYTNNIRYTWKGC